MPANLPHIRQYLKQFEFRKLFIEELGWDRSSGSLEIPIDGTTFKLTAVAQKRSMVVWLCDPDAEGNIPTQALLVKLERQVSKSSFEHLIVYHNQTMTRQLWQFAKRESGRPTYRTHRFDLNQSGESLAQKLAQIAFSLDEEEQTTLIDVTRRVRAAFYVEKVTKRFYEEFQEHHKQFLKFIEGIPDEQLQRWYASVMLNRLMFIYFIQKKGFLNNDVNYLRTKLHESKAKGKDQFYQSILVKLFFEGFAKKVQDRSVAMNKLLGSIPYLNGGLFLPHQIEEKYGKKIEIADKVFEHLFDYFDRYQWHLDERPLKDDLEINPDVLGYIFEKYINQKEMGAYYTKEDITGYNSQNTIIPRIFDIAKEKCAIAFEGEHSFWNLLKADPNRYIYEAVKKGTEKELPANIAAGISDVAKRIEWNKPADSDYALPTEIWREVVVRRLRYDELFKKLSNGEIHEINDFITYNLDIRQFAQDVIENCEGSDLLAAFWFAIEKLTVLDPTCGSGAFLFAALNILELLYEACLDRMQDFVDAESAAPTSPLMTKDGTQGRLQHFRTVLDRITKHPNRRYFIYKSIIVNNLFGVDIMEEAVEICKLRLFLKLVAQVESVSLIEPLPDIDFNIRAGNTLVGFARMEDYDKLFEVPLGFESGVSVMAKKVAQRQAEFNRQQLEDGSGSETLKKEIKKDLGTLAVHFDQELALAYGFFPKKITDKTKTEKLTEFIETHKPFHWCIEFFDIMSRGGFDVIIGNPPYVEYKEVKKDYKIINYDTLECGNLYAFTFERCINLSSSNGNLGLIIPVSSVTTDGYRSLRKLWLSKGSLYISSFNDRPGKLFEGIEHCRLSNIVLHRDDMAHRKVLTTRYNKWNSEVRDLLFETLIFSETTALIKDDSIPKLSNRIENDILSKMMSVKETLSNFVSEKGKHKTYYTRKLSSYVQVLDFVPTIIDNDGKKRLPSELKELFFDRAEIRDISVCALNSTLFFWLLVVWSDCRNLNKREVLGMPIDIDRFDNGITKLLGSLSNRLMTDFRDNSQVLEMKYQNWGKMKIQCIYPKHSKPIIDEIDRALAKHYDFTDEELDFIINYDIKYRMGKNNEEEE